MDNVAVIACDESGAEGENVTGAGHPVFVHASVHLTIAQAESVMAEVRRRAPSQAPEYKADQILRPAAANAAQWLLSDDGPLTGLASVFLVDKDYFVVGKVVDLLVEEVEHAAARDLYANGKAREWAWRLHRYGVQALGAEWPALLAAFNSLMRTTQRKGAKTTVDEFFVALDRVRLRSRRRDVEEVLAVMWRAKPHAVEFQERLVDGPLHLPSLDPLFAALPQTARTWSDRLGVPVRIVHDRQAALTAERVAMVVTGLARPLPEFRRFAPPMRLVAVSQVDSKDDPRVQTADLLAGLARQIATAALERSDFAGPAGLRAFVDTDSLWSDQTSWRALTGRSDVGR